MLGREAGICCELEQGQGVQMIQEGAVTKAAVEHLAMLESMPAFAPKSLACH